MGPSQLPHTTPVHHQLHHHQSISGLLGSLRVCKVIINNCKERNWVKKECLFCLSGNSLSQIFSLQLVNNLWVWISFYKVGPGKFKFKRTSLKFNSREIPVIQHSSHNIDCSNNYINLSADEITLLWNVLNLIKIFISKWCLDCK